MTSTSSISAVIPCFNHGRYIDDAVAAMKAQTCGVAEIIIVNDGSDDAETKDKLENYNDDDVTVYTIPNGGPSKARNYGISRSRGDIILLIDADDWCDKMFVERALPYLLADETVGGVSCGIQQVGSASRKYIPGGGGLKEFLVHPGALNFGLIKKKCWEEAGGYDENMQKIGYEDWDFWISVTKLGYKVAIVPDYLFYYRWHDQGDSRRAMSHENRISLIEQLVTKHLDVYSENVVDVLVKKEQKILDLKQERDWYISSLEYRVGKKILKPLRWFQNLTGKKTGIVKKQ